MRLLKSFFLTIAGFFIVITIVSLLMPSEVITSRTILIIAKPGVIMGEVKDLNNWREWHPLFASQKVEVSGNAGGQLAVWNVNGKTNQLRFTSATDQQAIFDVIQSGENIQQNKITVLQSTDSDNVQVEWSALTRLKWYPWEKFAGIFVDKITGAGYETALQSLKTRAEKISREN